MRFRRRPVEVDAVESEIVRRAQKLNDPIPPMDNSDECDHYWTAKAGTRCYCEKCDTWTPPSIICSANDGHKFTTGAIGGDYCKVCGFHPRVPGQRWAG